MTSELSDISLPELRKQVQSAVERIAQYKKEEREWGEKRLDIENRLHGIVKRIEEFSRGR